MVLCTSRLNKSNLFSVYTGSFGYHDQGIGISK